MTLRKIFYTLLLGLPLVFLVQCQSKAKKESNSAWPDKMQKMSQSVSALVPYIYSRKAFYDPKNEKKIKKEMVSFEKSIHEVPPKVGEKILGSDPLIKFSLQRLNEDVKRAIKSFDNGHKEYSRSLMRGTVSNCFACHSRSQFGPEFTLSASQFKGLKLQTTEKVDLMVATRQYDKAIEVLRAKLNDPINFYEDPYELERALKKYLAIMVRVKKDPSASITTLKTFLNRKNVPLYLSEDVKTWEKSLTRWSGEKGAVKRPVKAAKKLMNKGKILQGGFSHQAGHVEYLRASAILHDALMSAKNNRIRSEIYSLLGDNYEVISDLGFWEYPELYFEACVREFPKSQQAKECYKSFERSIIFGFSGSAGIFIPADERARLDELKALAGYN